MASSFNHIHRKETYLCVVASEKAIPVPLSQDCSEVSSMNSPVVYHLEQKSHDFISGFLDKLFRWSPEIKYCFQIKSNPLHNYPHPYFSIHWCPEIYYAIVTLIFLPHRFLGCIWYQIHWWKTWSSCHYHQPILQTRSVKTRKTRWFNGGPSTYLNPLQTSRIWSDFENR